MDDRDEWEDEVTILDQYQEQKQQKTNIKEVEYDIDPNYNPSFGIGGPGSALQRMSSANDYIAKALQTSPGGWMLTSINQTVDNSINCHGFQLQRPYPEAELNIRVTDPQLIATLHHAMQGYC